MKRSSQFELDLRPTPRWGGSRPGAGRKPGHRPRVWHRSRGSIAPRHPSHVTLRVRSDVPSLRTVRLVRELERSLRARTQREAFRVVHYSIQPDHIHMLVEATGAESLGRGMKSVAARIARAVNRVLNRRGPVLDGRYHHRVIRTPREARAALAYVLLNSRKHAAKTSRGLPPSAVGLDPASSGRWFDGWTNTTAQASDEPAVRAPRTWLLQRGWRRHGLIDPNEVPGTQTSNLRFRPSNRTGSECLPLVEVVRETEWPCELSVGH